MKKKPARKTAKREPLRAWMFVDPLGTSAHRVGEFRRYEPSVDCLIVFDPAHLAPKYRHLLTKGRE